jgi:hypothetical protein
MSIVIDYRQRLLDETKDLSPTEMEKIYEAVVFLKEKFILTDEARYYTQSWIDAEREATEVHERGELNAYSSVDEMMDAILAESETE